MFTCNCFNSRVTFKKIRIPTVWGIAFLLLQTSIQLLAQKSLVEGYIFESDNRGYLNLVEITIKSEAGTEYPLLYSSLDGSFKIELPSNKPFTLKAKKDLFHDKEVTFHTSKDNEKTFLKVEMERKPGYIFDMTIAKSRDNPNQVVDAVMGADIEIYNNTTRKEEALWLDHFEPHFKYTFNKGNHYTLLIRKAGFVAKLVEIFINVDGCILCVDGLGDLKPGVTDNLTAGLQMGSLLANINMDSVSIDKTFTFKNIYYEFGSADITEKSAKELMRVAGLMQQNPDLILELGSHTDSRGLDSRNYDLSVRRAAAAVDYLVKNGGIEPEKLIPKGYGETKILNKCVNGVDCNDREHGVNRRTELKVVGILNKDQYQRKSLAQMKSAEETERLIQSLQQQKIYEAKDTSSANKTIGSLGLFTGIRIELLISEEELPLTHNIYNTFKSVLHQELANGKHAYYTGQFKEALDARDFIVAKKIKSAYPKARLVQFQNGTLVE